MRQNYGPESNEKMESHPLKGLTVSTLNGVPSSYNTLTEVTTLPYFHNHTCALFLLDLGCHPASLFLFIFSFVVVCANLKLPWAFNSLRMRVQ